MTVAAGTRHIVYQGDGTTTSFTFPFKVSDKSHLEVSIDGVVQTVDAHYTVSGIGNLTGGTVTFLTAPPSGSVVSLRLVVPIEQLLDLVPNAGLPAESLEARLDRIVEMFAQVLETLDRTPVAPIYINPLARPLSLPLPGGDKVIGWDATGTALTLFDRTITVNQVTPPAGFTLQKKSVTISSTDNVWTVSSAAAIPANSRVFGVVIEITTGFGTSRGLSGIHIGDGTVPDLWGRSVPVTTGTKTTNAHFTLSDAPIYSVATDLVLTAAGGPFDATGQLRADIHYLTLDA